MKELATDPKNRPMKTRLPSQPSCLAFKSRCVYKSFVALGIVP